MTDIDRSWDSKLAHVRRRCGVHVHGHNAMPMMVATILFFSIAFTQYYYATIANSSALKADSISMFADSLSFFGAFLAEVIPGGSICGKDLIELWVSAVSLLILLGFTVKFLYDAGSELGSSTDGEDVDGNIVLWFALVGVLFDVTSLLSYVICGRHHIPNDSTSTKEPELENGEEFSTIELVSDSVEKLDNEVLMGKPHIGANMRAALLHIYSDTLRSITTLVAGVIILNSNSGSAKVDAVATLIVCGIIFVGVVIGIKNWFRDLRKYRFVPPVDDVESVLKNSPSN